MISDEVRNYVWQDMLDTSRCIRYYNDLRNKLLKQDSRIRNVTFFAGLFSIIGVVATTTSGTPFLLNVSDSIETVLKSTIALISLIGVVVCAVLSEWRSRKDFKYKAKIAAFIGINLGSLDVEYSQLWGELNLDDNSLNNSDVLAQRDRLLQKLTEITKIGMEERLVDDGKLNEQSAKDAYLELESRYATE